MIRNYLATIALLALTAVLGHGEPSMRHSFDLGQAAPQKDDGPAEKRSEIVERIKANQERVRKLLGENNSGTETRKLQSQIADDLAKLLETPDDPGSDPSRKAGAAPNPGVQPNQPSKQAAAPEAKPKAVGAEGRSQADAMRAGKAADGYWGELPAQTRKEIDAYPRDRLMPRYEELLRAYYRTIAERATSKEGDQR